MAIGQRLRGKATIKPSNYSLPRNGVIIRKPVPRLQVFTYTDILGSASFTGVKFMNQTTATLDTEDSSFPAAAEEKVDNRDENIEEEEEGKEMELVKVGEENKYEGREEEEKEKKVEDVGEWNKEDMKEKEGAKEVKVEKVEDKENKNGEKQVEYVEKGAKEMEGDEVEAGEQSIDSEVAIHSGNDTSRSLGANRESDGEPRDADSGVRTLQLDSEGSGDGCLNTLDTHPTSEPEQGANGSAVPVKHPPGRTPSSPGNSTTQDMRQNV